MNSKIKRTGLLLVLTLCVAFSTFAQTSDSDYRRQNGRNRSESIYRDRSDRARHRIRSRRSFSFLSILLQLLVRNPSDYDRRRSGRRRY